MEALTLARSDVLRSADVSDARERARQRRLRHLALLLGLVALPLVIRAVVGGLRYARGDLNGAASAFRWPLPHLPRRSSHARPVGSAHPAARRGAGRAAAGRRPVPARNVPPGGNRRPPLRRQGGRGSGGGGRQDPEPVPGLPDLQGSDGWKPAAGRPFRRSAGNGQDLPGQGHGSRSSSALSLRVLLGVPVDVLRPDEPQDSLLFQGAAGPRPARGRRHRVHRGDRRHRRHSVRGRARRRAGRASPVWSTSF